VDEREELARLRKRVVELVDSPAPRRLLGFERQFDRG
jgi:hypothetical protein